MPSYIRNGVARCSEAVGAFELGQTYIFQEMEAFDGGQYFRVYLEDTKGPRECLGAAEFKKHFKEEDPHAKKEADSATA